MKSCYMCKAKHKLIQNEKERAMNRSWDLMMLTIHVDHSFEWESSGWFAKRKEKKWMS